MARGPDPAPSRGRLIIGCGLPGSGTTTLAKKWATERGAVRFCPDDWLAALGRDLWEATCVRFIPASDLPLGEVAAC